MPPSMSVTSSMTMLARSFEPTGTGAYGQPIEPPAAEPLVGQVQRPEPPGVPVVSHLEAEEVEQDVQVLAVVGLGGRRVIVPVLVVVFDQSVQDRLEQEGQRDVGEDLVGETEGET